MRVKKGLLSSASILTLTSSVSATAPPSANSGKGVEARSLAYGFGGPRLTSLTFLNCNDRRFAPSNIMPYREPSDERGDPNRWPVGYHAESFTGFQELCGDPDYVGCRCYDDRSGDCLPSMYSDPDLNLEFAQECEERCTCGNGRPLTTAWDKTMDWDWTNWVDYVPSTEASRGTGTSRGEFQRRPRTGGPGRGRTAYGGPTPPNTPGDSPRSRFPSSSAAFFPPSIPGTDGSMGNTPATIAGRGAAVVGVKNP